ncbi:MAG: hypothetical protein FWD06_10395 [Oscillospiraceae bacterium]|nr:hypothetical protein [Oscillospiraceae bacterium]
MSAKEHVLQEINLMPTDDVIEMFIMWKNHRNMLELEISKLNETQEPSPWEGLRKFRGTLKRDIDIKKELAEYYDEKYTRPD